MQYTYKTKDTCSSHIKFEINGDVISNIQFIGGCSGNLTAIQRLVDGWTVDQIKEKCSGIHCGRRPTSCTDQLAIAVEKALSEQK